MYISAFSSHSCQISRSIAADFRTLAISEVLSHTTTTTCRTCYDICYLLSAVRYLLSAVLSAVCCAVCFLLMHLSPFFQIKLKKLLRRNERRMLNNVWKDK
jgi:hypothetical protein